MNPIRVVLADDHALVRAGFKVLLEQLHVEVVGEASDGNEALRLVGVLKPDLVLMDISMPRLNGLDATTRIVQAHPGVRVLILSMHASEEYAYRAIMVGASGYLLKDASAVELDLAISAVARGETYLSPRISKYIVADYVSKIAPGSSPLDRLTTRQREVLQLIAEGHSRRAIAEQLSISVKTFDTHRAQLMAELDIHDVAGLVRFAESNGLLERDE